MATSPLGDLRKGRLREQLDDCLYRTGYYLIIGTGVTSLLGAAFWALAARSYSAHDVGLNATAISAMTLVSGVCSLGLSAVLVRYLPIAGTATRKLISTTYAVTVTLSLVVGFLIALSSSVWSPSLSFLDSGTWLVGFALATAATTVFILQDNVLTGLRAAQWIPLENSLFAVAKLVLLIVLAGLLPSSGPFVAWNAPLLLAIVAINWLIYRRLIPADRSFGTLERRTVLRMAASNYAGNLFTLAGTLYLPVLVANLTSASDAAFFFVPWLFAMSLNLIPVNVTTSLTVEAATDIAALRSLVRRTLVHVMRLLLPLVAITLLAAPLILGIFGPDYADEGTALMRWLAIGAIPAAIVYLAVTIARIEHRGRIVIAAQLVHAVIVIGLSAALLPGMGIEGVGVAFTVSQGLLAVAMLATVLRPLLFGGGPARVGTPR
jgi:O-antigen/teichoic acid export membrane protein